MDSKYLSVKSTEIESSKVSSVLSLYERSADSKNMSIESLGINWSLKSDYKKIANSHRVNVDLVVLIDVESSRVANSNLFNANLEFCLDDKFTWKVSKSLNSAHIEFIISDLLVEPMGETISIECNLSITMCRNILNWSSITDIKKRINSTQIPALYGNEEFSDFTFVVDDREFKVNKCILGIENEVFKKMFHSKFSETRENYTIIKDIEPEVFDCLLKFIYGFKLNYDEIFHPKTSMVLKVYHAADKYGINALKEVCLAQIYEKYVNYLTEDKNVDVGNVYEVYCFADQYELKSLKKYCEEKFLL